MPTDNEEDEMKILSVVNSVAIGGIMMFAVTAAHANESARINEVHANEVIATLDSAAKSRSTTVALDFMSAGEVTTFEFEVSIPKGAVVDTTQCTAELPASHTGACGYNEKNGRVVVMVYSNTLTALPQGLVSIGKLAVSGKGTRGINVQNVLVSDKNSKALDARASTFDSAK